MFKAARWRKEKNKIKAVFKLQFQATQLSQLEWDALMVSVIPMDVGKATCKSEKAAVQNGACLWENPIYETVKLSREAKTGRINQKIYHVLVLHGSSKGGILGEVALDLASYAEAMKPSSVSLPLTEPNSGAVLHVTIQRMQGDLDGRERKNGDSEVRSHGGILKGQLSIGDTNGSNKADNDTISFNFTEDNSYITNQTQWLPSHSEIISQNADTNGVSDTIHNSILESRLEQNAPNECASNSDIFYRDVTGFLSSPGNNGNVKKPSKHRRSNTEWSVSSGPDGSVYSTNSSENTLSKEMAQGLDSSVDKLKNDLVILVRQAEVSELELQTLRKQIIKESRRGQDLSKEVCTLKEERNAFKKECEELRDSQQKTNKPQLDKPLFTLDEIRKELNYEKDLNANFQLQLQKTQESNLELIFAVRELEELLQKKNEERPSNFFSSTTPRIAALDSKEIYSSNLVRSKSREESEVWETVSNEETAEEAEQHSLEEVIKEHDETITGYPIDKNMLDESREIGVYIKDPDEIVMQIEQLTLDYEFLKQKNCEMSSKLEQSELQELKMKSESSVSLSAITELEAHIERLEKELENQAQAFEADLAEITREKVEQEQRAIRAEEALRKMRSKNATTAERLQEEFRILSVQMSFICDANEKLAAQAQAEACKLRVQKSQLENSLEKSNIDLGLVKDQYEVKVEDLVNKMDMKAKENEWLVLELEKKTNDVENQKRHGEERERDFLEEIQNLQTEIQVLIRKNSESSELLQQKEGMRAEMENLKRLIEERERLQKRGSMERDALKELHEGEITRKEADLENSNQSISERDKSLSNQIEELVKSVAENNQQHPGSAKDKCQVNSAREETAKDVSTKADLHAYAHVQNDVTNRHGNYVNPEDLKIAEESQEFESLPSQNDLDRASMGRNGTKLQKELKGSTGVGSAEMELLKKRNKSMEAELKELQDRYSEVSLKFAEVEGERQQLVMTIRNLKNVKKS